MRTLSDWTAFLVRLSEVGSERKMVCWLFPLQHCISELESTLTALHNEAEWGCLHDSGPGAFMIHCQVSGHHVSQCWVLKPWHCCASCILFLLQMSKPLHGTSSWGMTITLHGFSRCCKAGINHPMRQRARCIVPLSLNSIGMEWIVGRKSGKPTESEIQI